MRIRGFFTINQSNINLSLASQHFVVQKVSSFPINTQVLPTVLGFHSPQLNIPLVIKYRRSVKLFFIIAFFLKCNLNAIKEYYNNQCILSIHFSNMLCLHKSFYNSNECFCIQIFRKKMTANTLQYRGRCSSELTYAFPHSIIFLPKLASWFVRHSERF